MGKRPLDEYIQRSHWPNPPTVQTRKLAGALDAGRSWPLGGLGDFLCDAWVRVQLAVPRSSQLPVSNLVQLASATASATC